MRYVGVIRAVLVFALFAATCIAQSDVGSISGFVRDPSGSTIPKAKYTVS
jgi:hypothetical protein